MSEQSVTEPFQWSDSPVERLRQERGLLEELASIDAKQAALAHEKTLLEWAIRGYEAAKALRDMRSTV